MVFDSTVFLVIFLPISIVLYYLTPAKFKNLMLVFVSAVFYAWSGPVHFLLLAAVVLWNFAGGKLVNRGRKNKQAGKTTAIVVVVDILILVVFKYTGQILSLTGNALNDNRFFLIPIGLSFFMLQNIAYIADVCRGDAKPQKSFFDYAAFIMMFPKIVAGPLVPYSEFGDQIIRRRHSWNKFAEGCLRFVRGLSKTVILGSAFKEMFNVFYAFGSSQTSVLSAWLGSAAFAMWMFFSLAGYCDMAVGLGEIFGFEFPENINYPWMSTGIMDYWGRWMSTLWKWFCSYVYLPLCGGNPASLMGFLSLVITWILIGLWHGLNVTFVLWGILFAVLLYLEGFVFQQISAKIPSVIRWLFTIIILLVSWVFFFSPSVGDAFSYLGLMSGIGGHGIVDGRAISMIKTYGFLWITGILFSTPFIGNVFERVVSGEGRWKTVVNCIVYVLLTFLCFSRITSGSADEFFYFRF